MFFEFFFRGVEHTDFKQFAFGGKSVRNGNVSLWGSQLFGNELNQGFMAFPFDRLGRNFMRSTSPSEETISVFFAFGLTCTAIRYPAFVLDNHSLVISDWTG